MRYKLQILSKTLTGPPDLLNGAENVAVAMHAIQNDTGTVEVAVISTGIDQSGVEVVPGNNIYIFGFDTVFYYSGVGQNEAEWEMLYNGTYDSLNPAGQSLLIPPDCQAIRLQMQTDEPLPNGTSRWYVVEGTQPTSVFGVNKIWSRLDLGDDEPAMTYQANDIAELKDRQADYSQELRLPLTAHNLTVLGLPDHVDSQTDFPYTKIECRLYADEYELAGSGALLLIDGVTDAIECQVLGAGAGLFDQLEDSPMSALTDPRFEREYGGDLIPANFPTGIEFVAASFTMGGFRRLLNMDPRYMLPVVNDLYLFGKILESKGYSWTHNLADYTGTDKNALPVVTLDPGVDSFKKIDVHAHRTLENTQAFYKYYHLTRTEADPKGTWTNVGVDGSSSPDAYGRYTATDKGKLIIEVEIGGTHNGLPGSIGYTYVLVTKTAVDATVTEELELEIPLAAVDLPTSSQIEVELERGEVVKVIVGHRSGSAYYNMFVNLSVEHASEFVPLYGTVHVPMNLGFETQFDYFKAFVQRYGLTVLVDHAAQVVYTYTMKKVYDNKAFARDWSDKLVERGGEMSFRADGYARSNEIAFKDNDEDDVTDKGTFTVADATLDKEKTLFDLPFEAGLDWGVSDKFASIPVFSVPDLSDEITTDDERLMQVEYSGGNPHLLRVQTGTWQLNVTNAVPATAELYHRATHVTAQSLIDTYYAELTDSMLIKAKHRVDRFFLTPADIETFDPFVPVYLRQYGAYFYVNKISNFIVGRLTSVELIKL